MNATEKAPNAFRTIGEVSADLAIPQHILRFWEAKFPQLRPVKRSGNRRYYRPEDVALVQRIDQLLNHQHYSIAGVQRLLKLRDGNGLDEEALVNARASLASVIIEPATPKPLSGDSRFNRAALQTIRDILVDALERTHVA